MTKPTTPQQTPWIYQADDVDGRVLRITVDFNNTTRTLIQATIYRDVGCRYSKILVGVGADGKPDSTSRKFTVPEGTTVFNASQMSGVGLNIIEDILSRQITAGT